jgi:hypothetical protein
MYSVLQFRFPHKADRQGLEDDVALAIFAAECLYGRPRLRMEASYLVDAEGNACVMNVGGEAGEAAARIFAGLAAARFGEDSYTVRRMPQAAPSQTDPRLAQVGS